MCKAISLLGICVFLSMLFACKKEVEIMPVDVTVQYYPNTVGRYVDYQVDSLYYNLFSGTVDTFNYQVREEIVELSKDAEGRIVQRIQRYKRVGADWQATRFYSAYVGNKRVERTEENTSYIKMVFPLRKDSTWNGNAMNSLGTQNYACVGIHHPALFSSLTFDSCASISHQVDSTLISKNEEKEMYALHVGLIYKRSTHLEDRSSVIDPSISISKRANTGTDVRMYVIGFGIK